MCSNREKSLVINNGSISIIIFVHTKKKQTTTKTEEKNKMLPILYSHCDRADFHSALYIAFMGVLCRYCFVLFPFFSSFLVLYLRNTHQITQMPQRPSVSIKNRIIHNKYKFSIAFGNRHVPVCSIVCWCECICRVSSLKDDPLCVR